jgi:glutamyl-tRNA synthetase
VEEAQSAPHGRPGGGEGAAAASGPALRSLGYDGRCRGRYASWEEACAALPPGRLPVWRFRADPGVSAFDDRFLGRHVQDAAALGDFAFARDPDGAGYQLACVVDDAAMGVTEVLRGDDLAEATHAQLALQAALGLPRPDYVHVPLVIAPDGRRLAKRHGDTRLAALRAAGVPARRVVGLLAWWSGLGAFGAETSPEELLPRFDLGRVPRAPAVLDDRAWRFLGLPAPPAAVLW